MKVAVMLSGCGVYDGSEIHESVLTLLALDKQGIQYDCFAPDIAQHHVINHTNGEEMDESRNVLIESARIARGAISDVKSCNITNYDALVIPGGFGAAKNFTKWAFEGPAGAIDSTIADIISNSYKNQKPIVAMCMSPVVLAKALENKGVTLSVGTTKQDSPYDIKAIHQGMQSLGAQSSEISVNEIQVDEENKIITTPCYMMEASISEISISIEKAITKLKSLIA
jgi:enhancing lycopene biosynthesis protein 2